MDNEVSKFQRSKFAGPLIYILIHFGRNSFLTFGLQTLPIMNITNEQHPEEVVTGLNALRERAELTDVVLEVEGRSFPCHRVVLASCSPYFRSMFTSGYAEANQGSVSIRDVSEVAMATILDYAYTGCLKTDPDDIQAVMFAATLLQVDFVCQKAADYMQDLLDESNCADVLMYADMLGDLGLQEACRTYMASRFNQVMLQPSFVQLSLPQLQSVLNRDDLLTASEDNVVQAAFRWIDFNQEERQQHLPVLCRSLRHPFISSKLLAQLQSKCLSAECKLAYSDNTTRRLGQVRSEVLIFLKGRDEADNNFSRLDNNLPNIKNATPCYDPCKGKLYKMNIPDNLYALSMVETTDGELYLTGGTKTTLGLASYTSIRYSRTVPQKGFYQYNHLLDSWEPRCEMISARARCGLVYLKGYIYAIGGDLTTSAVERYDPSCDKWTSIAPIPYPMSSELFAVTLDNSIYVISEEGCYYFSTINNSWGKTADMRTPPWSPQAVTYEGCIFCVDCDKSKTLTPHNLVQMYNPSQGVWRCMGDDINVVSAERYHPTLMLCEESLFLLLVRPNPCSFSLWELPKIYLFQYQIQYRSGTKTHFWLRITESTMARMVPPMVGWLGGVGRTDCLMARIIPGCIGNDANVFKDVCSGEGDNDDDINIFDSPIHEFPESVYSYSEDITDQESSDVENSDDEESETDDDDI